MTWPMAPTPAANGPAAPETPPAKPQAQEPAAEATEPAPDDGGGAQVVSLDAFRKKT